MFLIRVLIIGETGVGKTSLLVRFNEGTFTLNQKTTIGVDYKAKELIIKHTVTTNAETLSNADAKENETDDRVKLQIWDTAGQERFRSMTSAFYSKAQGVVLTFDVCQRDSFLSLPSWIKDIRRDAPAGCIIVLCANKVDFEESIWLVKREEFTAFAKQHNFPLFEASGKSGVNVQEMFAELGRVILVEHRAELQEITNGLDPIVKSGERSIVLTGAPPPEKKKSSWC